ncbi:sugar kinase [Sediminibacillus halophilus]|uniref:2-dehydro-3-deoxygluconokinase n=1 Tax=Sediminibacillus halophilus TaxID=482461 RepID=A0A1G9RE94_9BACI|nr:sugar kinase [Sediminibacillus halophilus]SDM21622.1 2-dehydro-3-deoxygluconokinase [Sediminibacillus halophilus]
MLDVITIGDGMITFNPKNTGPMRFVNEFERKVGGAELNFAVGCARLGLRSGWISRVGKDEFGKFVLNFMRGEGVDVTEARLVDGYPTSVNFKEIRESGDGKTFYYREKSPTETMTLEDIDEDYIKRAKVLHITGVFPAISERNVELVRRAVLLAKKHGLKVSFDPNIRLKLWSEAKAREVLKSFLPDVDILLAGIEELSFLFEMEEQEESLVAQMQPYDIEAIVIKKGAEGSVGYIHGQRLQVPGFPVGKVVDTVGAGDGFDAGFIYAWKQNWTPERILTFANAVGALVVSVAGDNEGLPDLDEVLEMIGEKQRIER